MAASRKPGPICAATSPVNICDGTSSLQVSPHPASSGVWYDVETVAEAAYQALSKHAASIVNHGVSVIELERAVLKKYGQEAITAAEGYLQRTIAAIKGAAD